MRFIPALIVLLFLSACSVSLSEEVLKERVIEAEEHIDFYIVTEQIHRLQDNSGREMLAQVDRENNFAYQEFIARNSSYLYGSLLINNQTYTSRSRGEWNVSLYPRSINSALDRYNLYLDAVLNRSWNIEETDVVQGKEGVWVSVNTQPDESERITYLRFFVDTTTYHVIRYETEKERLQGEQVFERTQTNITFNDINDRTVSKYEDFLKILP